MALYRLSTAHFCSLGPGNPAAYHPAGTVVDLGDAQPSVSMQPLDAAGEAARLRADISYGRVTPIPQNWQGLDAQARYELAIAVTRTMTRAIPAGLLSGPKVTLANADQMIAAEQVRRSSLLTDEELALLTSAPSNEQWKWRGA